MRKNTLRLTESELNRVIKRIISEMDDDMSMGMDSEMNTEEQDFKSVKKAIEKYMHSIASKDPEFQREKIKELINVHLRPYLASLEGMKKVGQPRMMESRKLRFR